MTLFYILLAALMCYGLLLLFKQQAMLKDRITNLERQKQETEEILLQFMEHVNELTGTEASVSSPRQNIELIVPADEDERPEPLTEGKPVELVPEKPVFDVKQQLEEGADLDQLARSLNRGAGEVALIAKLSKKTKVARR
ncbi:hypothetical protein [Exiguobacterium undae]|nr:hypothetical protein [Exiguobacterium undae]